MSKLNIEAINSAQERLIAAFEMLNKACQAKKQADAKQWELRDEPKALIAFQPEWDKAFSNRTLKRKEACELVRQYPNAATDLIERLVAKVLETENGT